MKDFYLEKDNLLLLDGDKVHIKDKWKGVAIIPKSLLDTYAEEYIKDNFEMSDDGWVRILKGGVKND